MDIPQQINHVVFAENDLQLVKLWQWNVVAAYEDKETGIFKVLLRGHFFNAGGVSTFVNPDGTRLTQLEFDYIDDFHDGLAKVAIKGQGYGYINTEGEIIFPLKYDYAEFFRNGFCSVIKDNKFLLLNKNGREITVPEKYIRLGRMSHNRCRASTIKIPDLAYHSDHEDIAGWWGFLDENGKEVIKPQYIYADDFEDGMAMVCKGEWTQSLEWDNKYKTGGYWSKEELWGFIDVDGNEVIPCQYDEIDFFNGAADDYKVCTDAFKVHIGGWENGKWGVIDRNGKWLAPPIFNNISYDYQDGLFVFYEDRNVPGDECRDALYGVYDIPNQKILFEPQFTDVYFMKNGLFCIETVDSESNGTERIIDRTGKEVFASDYSGIRYYHEPYVVNKGFREDALYGVINTDGSVVLPCKYKTPWGGISCEDKTIIFIEDGRQGMMDFNENILISADKQEISRLATDLYLFKKDNLYGIVLKSGQIVLPAEYGKISLCRNNRIIANGKNGVEVFEIKVIS